MARRGREGPPSKPFVTKPGPARPKKTVADLEAGACYSVDKPPFGLVWALHPRPKFWVFLARDKGSHAYYEVNEDGTVEQISGTGAPQVLTLDDFTPTGEIHPKAALLEPAED